MYYVAVLVADPSYHGTEALTYGSAQLLPTGTIVIVPLRSKQIIGVVVNTTTHKPNFVVKPVTETPNISILPSQLIALLSWLKDYYPAPLGTVVQQVLPKELPKKPVDPLPAKRKTVITLPPLTKDQQNVLPKIGAKGLHILHGDTGSGKTRIYIELTHRAVNAHKSALIITPEIGLTSQLAETFEQVFPQRVVVIHSQLTEATRRKIWLTLLQETEPVVIIGPRSALFSPVKEIGLIIIDEAHETAYKQDKSPYYHASVVGSRLAALHNAPIILGSATPLVTDYYVAQQKGRPILRMTLTATSSDRSSERTMKVIDLRDRTQFSKKSPLSDVLIAAMHQALANKEQILLFLNRRGTARIIMCNNCGWQAVCPHCDLPLIYHGDSHSVRCHSCNYQAKPPTNCSECHNSSVIFKSLGTKAIAEEVQRLFPEAVAMRFDTDNKKDERIEQHYTAIHNGQVDILIGTQTLAKGLDLPNLSLVGAVMADASLYVPDFSSQERTYQLLSQVIGRVGRGHRDSTVIIQTYAPDSPLLKSVLTKDWTTFYTNELHERKQYLFPPFCFLLKVWCRRATQKAAQKASENLAEELRRAGLEIVIEGPAPSFHEKVADKYQWQLIIKAKQRGELLRTIKKLPSGWSHDIDPMNLL